MFTPPALGELEEMGRKMFREGGKVCRCTQRLISCPKSCPPPAPLTLFSYIVVPPPSLDSKFEPLDSLAPLRAASSSGVGSAPPRLLPHLYSRSHWSALGAEPPDWLPGSAQATLRAQRRCAPLADRLAGAEFSFNLVCLLI